MREPDLATRAAAAPQPSEFQFRGYGTDENTGLVELYYAYDNGLTFTEKIAFGRPLPSPSAAPGRAFHACLRSLSIAAGVSYYKAFMPSRICLGNTDLSKSERRFFQDLYVGGLGEFGYRNNIDVAKRVDFLSANPSTPAPGESATPIGARGECELPRKSAVLIGGGKDSLASVEILRAGREPMALFAVNPKKPILDCIRASGLLAVTVDRALDPRLFELNARGALNGHVPITAILTFIALAGAFVFGYDTVVLSNERSANEGNVVVAGTVINHQYSKSLAFESALRDHIAASLSADLDYVSLLRPLSELHITQLMARFDRYDEVFTSCNKSFRIRPSEAPPRWCLNCPKCRFTFLALANAVPRGRLDRIFGANMLDDGTQVGGYEELVGLSGHKPWECVGEIGESATALLRLAARPEWSGSAVISSLAPRLRQVLPDPDEVWKRYMTPSAEHFLPDRYARLLHAYL